MDYIFRKTLITLIFFMSGFAMASLPNQVTLSKLHIENTSSDVLAIVGNVHNDTNTTLKKAYVEFNLYQDGTIIGETFDEEENIGPGENWRLHAPIDNLRGKPDSFKVTDIQVIN